MLPLRRFFSIHHQSYLPGIILFVLAVVVGLCVYQDYGIGWDEPLQREMGMVSYNYVFEGDTTLRSYIDRDHGVGVELPLVMLEKGLGLEDKREVFLMRHVAGHLFFLVGAFCAYVLATRLFANQWMGIAAFMMVWLHPRLYGHSFVNTKDVPLMVMFIVSMLVAHIAFGRGRWPWMLAMGMAVGFATSIRVLGVVLFAGFLLFLLVDMVAAMGQKTGEGKAVMNVLCFVAGSCGMLYIAWPTLWETPVKSFVECFESMSYFRWPYTVLFRGATTPAGELSPWYLPIWIGISTLVVWLVVFVFGIGAGLVAWLRKPLEFFYNTPHRHIVLYLYLAIAPLTMVIALGSIVYDDWRHLYFIYPALVMLGLYGVTKLKNKGLSRIVLVLIFMQSGVAAYQLIKLHPFQIVYFNSLVSHDEEALRHNYEMDYWGTGYKQALEYLIANAPEQEIKIVRGKPPLIFNVDILQVQDRPRIKFVEEAEATYFVTNFRTHPEDYPYPNVVYEIKRQNSTILRIYKLR